jgi:hypothetical protein
MAASNPFIWTQSDFDIVSMEFMERNHVPVTMLSTHVRHGDLVIDMDASGEVQITRQSNAAAIRLSFSEWLYLQRVANLHGWPMCPPRDSRDMKAQS